jgi:hypothetical protein
MIHPEIFGPGGNIPVLAAADICVLRGSCTGLFAAIRASRLGVKVVIVGNKSGRGATRASYFIDATDDGNVAERAGLESYRSSLSLLTLLLLLLLSFSCPLSPVLPSNPEKTNQ